MASSPLPFPFPPTTTSYRAGAIFKFEMCQSAPRHPVLEPNITVVYNHLLLHVNVNTVHFSNWYHSYWSKKKLNRIKWHIQFHALQGLKWCMIYRGIARFLCPRWVITMAVPNRSYKLGRKKKHYLLIFLQHIWLNNLKFVKSRKYFFFYLLCILTLLEFYCLGRCTTRPPSLQLHPQWYYCNMQ